MSSTINTDYVFDAEDAFEELGGSLRLDQPNRIDEMVLRYDEVLEQIAVLEKKIQVVLDGMSKPC
jgi:hypothetical protein